MLSTADGDPVQTPVGGAAPKALRDELAMQRFLRYEATRDADRRVREKRDAERKYPRNPAAGQWAMSDTTRSVPRAAPVSLEPVELEAFAALPVPTAAHITGEMPPPPSLLPENKRVPPSMHLRGVGDAGRYLVARSEIPNLGAQLEHRAQHGRSHAPPSHSYGARHRTVLGKGLVPIARRSRSAPALQPGEWGDGAMSVAVPRAGVAPAKVLCSTSLKDMTLSSRAKPRHAVPLGKTAAPDLRSLRRLRVDKPQRRPASAEGDGSEEWVGGVRATDPLAPGSSVAQAWQRTTEQGPHVYPAARPRANLHPAMPPLAMDRPRFDPSFLPLEPFDDVERFEKLHPEAWLPATPRGARGGKGANGGTGMETPPPTVSGAGAGMSLAQRSTACSRWHHEDGSWTWRAVRVLGYSHTSGRFLVEWCHLATDPQRPWAQLDPSSDLAARRGVALRSRKFVSRLNLRFDVGDDPFAHEERVSYAMDQRCAAERRMRQAIQLSALRREVAEGGLAGNLIPAAAFPPVVMANVLARCGFGSGFGGSRPTRMGAGMSLLGLGSRQQEEQQQMSSSNRDARDMDRGDGEYRGSGGDDEPSQLQVSGTGAALLVMLTNEIQSGYRRTLDSMHIDAIASANPDPSTGALAPPPPTPSAFRAALSALDGPGSASERGAWANSVAARCAPPPADKDQGRPLQMRKKGEIAGFRTSRPRSDTTIRPGAVAARREELRRKLPLVSSPLLGAALAGALSELARLEQVPLLEGAKPVPRAAEAYQCGHQTAAATAASLEEFAFAAASAPPEVPQLAPRELGTFLARQRQQFGEATALASGPSAAVLSDLVFDAYDDQCRELEAAEEEAKSRTVRQMALEAARRRRERKLRKHYQESIASASPAGAGPSSTVVAFEDAIPAPALAALAPGHAGVAHCKLMCYNALCVINLARRQALEEMVARAVGTFVAMFEAHRVHVDANLALADTRGGLLTEGGGGGDEEVQAEGEQKKEEKQDPAEAAAKHEKLLSVLSARKVVTALLEHHRSGGLDLVESDTPQGSHRAAAPAVFCVTLAAAQDDSGAFFVTEQADDECSGLGSVDQQDQMPESGCPGLVFEPPLSAFDDASIAVLDELRAVVAAVTPVDVVAVHADADAGPPRLPSSDAGALADGAAPAAALAGAAAQVREVVEGNFDACRVLAGTLAPFSLYFNLDVDAELEKLVVSVPAPKVPGGGDGGFDLKRIDVEAARAAVEKHRAAAKAVSALLPPTVHLKLFSVHCAPLTSAISAAARSLVDALLARVCEDLAADATALDKAWAAYYALIAVKPATVEAFGRLKKALATEAPRVAEASAAAVVTMRTQLSALTAHRFALTDELSALVWGVFVVPKRVGEITTDTQALMPFYTDAFSAEFQDQQEAFAAELSERMADADAALRLGMEGWEDSPEIAASVTKLQSKVEDAEQESYLLNARERVLDWPQTEYEQLEQLTTIVEPCVTLWTLVAAWDKRLHNWMDGLFWDLDRDTVVTHVQETLGTLHKQEAFFASRNHIGPQGVAGHLRGLYEGFRKSLPVIAELRNPALSWSRPDSHRHWEHLCEELGIEIAEVPKITLRFLLESGGAAENIDVISDVSEVATQEHELELAMFKMAEEWTDAVVRPKLQLQFKPFKATGVFVMVETDAVLENLEEQLARTHSMLSSPYVEAIEERVSTWFGELQLLQDTLDEWVATQLLWQYLKPVFLCDDISRQMPALGKDFGQIDAMWSAHALKALEDRCALSLTQDQKLLPTLRKWHSSLEVIMSGLNAYLNLKRHAFPRFFFLSNDELLAILALTKDPVAVQMHLPKCFEGISALAFDENSVELRISAMASAEGEWVPFAGCGDCGAPDAGKKIAAARNLGVCPIAKNRAGKLEGKFVEVWLTEVEAAMRVALHEQLRRAIVHGAADQQSVLSEISPSEEMTAAVARVEWVLRWPGQVVLAASQLFWTRDVESALQPAQANVKAGHVSAVSFDALACCASKQLAQLEALLERVRSHLSSRDRLTVGSLVVLDVHARDVLDQVRQAVGQTGSGTDAADFEWTIQMRYYWTEAEGETRSLRGDGQPGLEEDKKGKKDKDEAERRQRLAGPYPLEARIMGAMQLYCYEYLGNSGRLVITPLTDRCYRTLMQAVHLFYGGAPEGPAGTGKTETTKDLCKAVGNKCVVFNCSDSLDYQALGKFFKGLAGCGAWACFDEFNRIDIEVLSVVASQVQTLQQGARAGDSKLRFEGEMIAFKKSCAVFITMNPGYSGRTELPDNLKTLFRTIAMMVPDYAMIAEISLYSCGFSQARVLAIKLTKTLSLASEQVSAQDHYDFGMRAVKSCIVRAGALKLAQANDPEAALMLQAINDCNLPKFTAPDQVIFRDLTSDLFPQSLLQDTHELKQTVVASIASDNEAGDSGDDGGGAATVSVPVVADGLSQGITNACHSSALVPTDRFRAKCEQLQMTLTVRHGVMLVGEAASGKTCVYRTLARALNLLAAQPGHVVGGANGDGASYQVMNPKAQTLSQLYGGFDRDTHEWNDGVLCNAVRRYVNDGPNAAGTEGGTGNSEEMARWLVMDGPVDAIWIENMNTVLDDNKKLCLNSGEILSFLSSMRMLFEVEDLAVASPATVSRCGMVLLQPADVGWKPLLNAWIDRTPPALTEHRAAITRAATHLLPRLLASVRGCAISAVGGGDAGDDDGFCGVPMTELQPSTDLGLVASFLDLLEALLGPSFYEVSAAEVRRRAMKAKLKGAGKKAVLMGQLGKMSIGKLPVKSQSPELQAKSAAKGMGLGGASTKSNRLTAKQMSDMARPVAESMGSEEAASQVSSALLFALVWSVGATLDAEGRRRFSDKLRQLLREPVPDEVMGDSEETDGTAGEAKRVSDWFASQIPAAGTVFEYQFLTNPVDDGDGGSTYWQPWDKLLKTQAPPAAAVPFRDVIIPTPESAQTAFLLSLLVSHGKHVMFVGPTGTGKTAGVRSAVMKLDSQMFAPSIMLQVSSEMSPNVLQDTVEGRLDKRRKGVLGPPGDLRMVAFVDDVSMARPDRFGSHPPLELLRQWMDHQGWYQRGTRDTAFRNVVGLCWAAAMVPTDGGRPSITQRLLRHFNVVGCPAFEAKTLRAIFDAIASWGLGSFEGEAGARLRGELKPRLVEASLAIYGWCIENMLPTPSKPLYKFNMRDLSRLFQGLLAVDRKAFDPEGSQKCPSSRPTAAVPVVEAAPAEGEIQVPASGHGEGGDFVLGELAWLWRHESARVFADRMMVMDDLRQCEAQIDLIAAQHFSSEVTENDKVPGVGQGELGEGENALSAALRVAVISRPSTAAAVPDNRPLFGTFTGDRFSAAYQRINGYPELRKALLDGVVEINSSSGTAADFRFVAFTSAMEHVARVARVLNLPRGHLLLVGVVGSGRTTAVRLATRLVGGATARLDIPPRCTQSKWREILTEALLRAGLAGSPLTVPFSDSQSQFPGMLDDLCTLLNGGDYASWFSQEQHDKARAEVGKTPSHRRLKMQKKGKAMTEDEEFGCFLRECDENLHLVFRFEAAGEALQSAMVDFPALRNCCTIDVYHAWPRAALQAVAESCFENLELPGLSPSDATAEPKVVQSAVSSPKIETVLAICAASVHDQADAAMARYSAETGRHPVAVTPGRYLQLTAAFGSLLERKGASIQAQRDRYTKGCAILERTAASVAGMQRDVDALQPVLEAKTVEIAALLETVTRSIEAGDETRRLVAIEEEKAAAKATTSQGIKDECTEALAAAIPALSDATAALKTLKKRDLDEIKALGKPPANIKLAMEGICVMLGSKPNRVAKEGGRGKVDDYWDAAKKLLSNPKKLLTALETYDKDNIKPEIMEIIDRKYMTNPQFVPEVIKKSSIACEGMCKWVRAMSLYDRVYKEVTPRRMALAEAELALADALALLAAKQALLQEAEDATTALRRKLDTAQKEQHELGAKTQLCIDRKERAVALLESLGQEEERWGARSIELQTAYANLLGDALIGSAAVVYSGALGAAARNRLLTRWTDLVIRAGVPLTPGAFDCARVLGDDLTINRWVAEGLPADAFSVQNGLFVVEGMRTKYPLLLDPQGQANKWVRHMEGGTDADIAARAKANAPKTKSFAGSDAPKQRVIDDGLVVAQVSETDFAETLKRCCVQGGALLLENVPPSLHPLLEPVLLAERNASEKGSHRTTITVGGATVRLNGSFRLYMTTNLANPRLSVEHAAMVSVVNFNIAAEGLSEQLLRTFLHVERPDDAEQRDRLLHSSATYREELAQLEDAVLALLSEVSGNLLDDLRLIAALGSSKAKSVEVSRALKAAEETQRRITRAGELYRPLATRGSQLYFAIAGLAQLQYFYQFSFGWVASIFVNSVMKHARENGKPPSDARSVKRRVATLVEEITLAAYVSVARSLFEADKLLLGFMIACAVVRGRHDAGEAADTDAPGGIATEPELRFLLTGTVAELALPTAAADDTKGTRNGDSTVGESVVGATGAGEESKEDVAAAKAAQITTQAAQKAAAEEAALLGMPNPAPKWLPDRAWAALRQLSRLPRFRGLAAGVSGAPDAWRPVFGAPDLGMLTSAEIPQGWGMSLKQCSFGRLLLTSCFAPHRLRVPAIQGFVGTALGRAFIEPLPFDLAACHAESTEVQPLLFVLSAGQDPSEMLARFVREKKQRLSSVSLGQGQGPVAAAEVARGRDAGHWVLLQNCHLAVSWLPELAAIVAALTPETTHTAFRLWLSSAPTTAFPQLVLQGAIKMVNEAPEGLRAHLARSYNGFDEATLTACDERADLEVVVERRNETNGMVGGGPAKTERQKREAAAAKAVKVAAGPRWTRGRAWRKLLYGLCFFHATVQERRKFGPMGWAVPYGFSGADLRISTEQVMERLQMMPEEGERGAGTPQLPLKWLRYAVGALNYGGRVTDARDRRTLLHVLSGFLCDGVLTDGHAFSPSGVYASPPDGSLKEYRAFIEKLPINDAPEVFGLHGNAELTLRLRESQTLLTNANIMLNGGGAGALGAEKEAQVLKAAARIGAQLPTEAPFDAAAVLRRFPPKYEESMNTVLVNEVRAWQGLLPLPSADELHSLLARWALPPNYLSHLTPVPSYLCTLPTGEALQYSLGRCVHLVG